MTSTEQVTPSIGDAVEFVDPYGQAHVALVTAVHGREAPSLNVVLVVDDDTQHDSYGRQIERYTSVVHESRQAAHGMFWRTLKP